MFLIVRKSCHWLSFTSKDKKEMKSYSMCQCVMITFRFLLNSQHEHNKTSVAVFPWQKCNCWWQLVFPGIRCLHCLLSSQVVISFFDDLFKNIIMISFLLRPIKMLEPNLTNLTVWYINVPLASILKKSKFCCFHSQVFNCPIYSWRNSWCIGNTAALISSWQHCAYPIKINANWFHCWWIWWVLLFYEQDNEAARSPHWTMHKNWIENLEINQSSYRAMECNNHDNKKSMESLERTDLVNWRLH